MSLLRADRSYSPGDRKELGRRNISRQEESGSSVDISEKPREISISLWSRSDALGDGKEEK